MRTRTKSSYPQTLLFLREHFELLSLLLFVFCVVVALFFYLRTPRSTFATTPYSDLLFDDAKIHKINITLSESNRLLQLSAPEEKYKYPALVQVDGEIFSSVSFYTHGNASLSETTVNESNNKFSYKISFSRLNPSQTYHGLDKLILNPFHNDPSYLHDYLAYTIMRELGVPAPLVSFTELSINGEPQGLYLATEDINHSFLARNSISESAALFKPETAYHNIFNRRRYEESSRLPEIAETTSEGFVVPYYQGADLVYRGDSALSYSDIFSNAVTKYSPKDEEYIIRCIKSLAPTETAPAVSDAPSPASPSNPNLSCWDIAALARYFAAHNFIINRDSYVGAIAHNYYLLLSGHQLTFLPWDYNYAFQGFTINDEVLTEIPEETSIFTPFLGVPDSERPLWAALRSDPDFIHAYLSAFETLLNNYINNGLLSEKISSISSLIRRHVAADPNRTATLSEYDESVEYLKNFIHARALSVQRQIWDYKKLPANGEENLEEIPAELETATPDYSGDIIGV